MQEVVQSMDLSDLRDNSQNTIPQEQSNKIALSIATWPKLITIAEGSVLIIHKQQSEGKISSVGYHLPSGVDLFCLSLLFMDPVFLLST